MGCDIHTYLEYTMNPEPQGDRGPYWCSWGERVNPGRNYGMFGLLAGVRGSYTHSFKPKGLPDNLSYTVASDALLRIVEDSEDDWEGYCTVKQAVSWGNPDAKIGDVIDHPDWHSHSWLTPDEYAQVLGRYLIEFSHTPGIEYEVMLDLMRALEERGATVRLVFWFDN